LFLSNVCLFGFLYFTLLYAGKVEFGVFGIYKITIALLLVATKPGRSELIMLPKQDLTRHLETRCSSLAAIDTLMFILADHFLHDEKNG